MRVAIPQSWRPYDRQTRLYAVAVIAFGVLVLAMLASWAMS